MKHLLIGLGILLLGAVILCPAIAMMNLEPLQGDFAFHYHNQRIVVPVVYSLCASGGLALFYYVLKG